MAVTNGYCTLAQLRVQLDDTGTLLSVELLERAINATSRAIDRFTGTRFWLDSTVQAKTYRPDDPYEADIDDIGTTTGLIVKTSSANDGTYDLTWATTDYQLEPLDAEKGGDTAAYSWNRLVAIDRYTFPVASTRRTTLQVTAKYGWSAVPVDVEAACLLKAARLFERRKAPLGLSAAVLDFGPVRISKADSDVIDLLHPYVRYGVGAVG